MDYLFQARFKSLHVDIHGMQKWTEAMAAARKTDIQSNQFLENH